MFIYFRKAFLFLLKFIILLTLLLNILFFAFQKSLIYFPGKEMSSFPSGYNLEYKDIYLNAPGFVLHGWEVPNPQKRAYLLYFSGNAGNISKRTEVFRLFFDAGFHVFAFDYPGYGMSTGKPSIKSIRSALGCIDAYMKENISRDDLLFVHGFSLGGAVGVLYCSKYEADALILESTFTSLDDMARHHYPFLAVSIINREGYNTRALLPKIEIPRLILHAVFDEVVPYEMGKKLYHSCKENCLYADIQADHNSGILKDRESYKKALEALFDSLLETGKKNMEKF